MIDTGVLVTGGIGMITTITSGWVSWFFARKKYNSEVDNILIENMSKSLDFYKQLSTDNRERLDDLLSRNTALEREIQELKTQVLNLATSICTDFTCLSRKREINDINNEADNRENKE